MDDTDRKRFTDCFKFVCRKCGSEDVTIDADPGCQYSELTSDPPSLSMGCNNCKANDVIVDLY